LFFEKEKVDGLQDGNVRFFLEPQQVVYSSYNFCDSRYLQRSSPSLESRAVYQKETVPFSDRSDQCSDYVHYSSSFVPERKRNVGLDLAFGPLYSLGFGSYDIRRGYYAKVQKMPLA
jgi:hypothetical protein